MPESPNVRIGIINAGSIFLTRHLPNLRRIEGGLVDFEAGMLKMRKVEAIPISATTGRSVEPAT